MKTVRRASMTTATTAATAEAAENARGAAAQSMDRAKRFQTTRPATSAIPMAAIAATTSEPVRPATAVNANRATRDATNSDTTRCYQRCGAALSRAGGLDEDLLSSGPNPQQTPSRFDRFRHVGTLAGRAIVITQQTHHAKPFRRSPVRHSPVSPGACFHGRRYRHSGAGDRRHHGHLHAHPRGDAALAAGRRSVTLVPHRRRQQLLRGGRSSRSLGTLFVPVVSSA